MAMHIDDTGEFGGEAPRPIDADTVKRGTFDQLGEGQGAVSASSKHLKDLGDPHPNGAPLPVEKRTLGIIVVAALLVIAIIVFVFIRVLDAPAPKAQGDAEPEQTAVAADENIVSRGGKYELVENGGTYQLIEIHEADGGQSVSLGDLPGTPVSLVLYDGALIIPENLSDGTWDVMAYTIGSGWSQIAGQDGNVVSGKGTIQEASLEGSTVILTVDGSRVEVPLVW